MTVGLRSWHLLALATASLAIGCSNVGGQSGGSTVYDDAGNCVKDREALSQILVQPQACVSSTECPPGSFCNGETGQCDWECYTDSDCGFGASCTCDGICLDGSPPGPGATEDPACPRDLDLLQQTSPDPDIHDRECTRDEHCPYGARCDEVTHRCDYDCLADTDCTGGDVCNCRGECVEPGCAEPIPERHVPTVEVTPDVITVLPGNTWGKQTFSIRITDPDATIADPDPTDPTHPAGLLPRARIEAPTPEGLGNLGIPQSTAVAETVNTYAGVHFSTTEETNSLAHANTASSTTLTSGGIPVAVADRMVAARTASGGTFAGLASVLDVDGAGASTLQALKTATQVSGTACTIQVRELLDARWVVTKTDGYSATTSVSISRCSAADSYPRDVRVSVYFVDAADTTKVVENLANRTVQIDTAGAPSLTATDPTGEFSGYLVQEHALGEPLTIPVRAWRDSSTGNLVVADDLKLLSSTGWFQLSTSGPTFLNHINQATGNGGVSPGQTPGVLAGELGNWTDELLTGGRRDGHFTLALASSPEQPLAFRYRLVRKGIGSAPSVPSSPTAATNTLATMVDAWRAKSGFLHSAAPFPTTTRNNLIERLLCYAYDDSLGATAGLLSGPFEQEFSSNRAWPQLIFSAASRDLQCSSHSQTAVGLITGWENWTYSNHEPTPESPITNAPMETAAWLHECLNDLARDIPNLGDADTVTEQTDTWFGAPGSCINLSQFLPGLASLIFDQIDGAAARTLDRRDAALFQRLLAQWLDVHAFVLQQGVQDAAAAAPLFTEEAPTPIETLLARAERGWDVLLDADHLAALAGLTATEIADLDYRRPRPTSYWTFDDADRSSSHMVDVAGGNHLNFIGNVTTDAPGINLASSTYASIPSSRLSLRGDVAVSFWIKPSSVSPPDFDIKILDAGDSFFVSARRSSATGTVRITFGQGGWSYTTPSALQTTPTWQHVIISRRNNYYNVFFGGSSVPLGTAPPTSDPGPNASGVTRIGQTGTGSVSIDDMAIWDHALSLAHAQQITDLGQSSTLPVEDRRPLLRPVGSVWTPGSEYYVPPDPNAEMAVGLPIKILEAAARHAEVVDAYVVQELSRDYGGCFATGSSTEQQASIARASASLRYVNAAEALARKLRAQAGQVACTGTLECTAAGGLSCGGQGVCMAEATTLDVAPAWDARYQASMLELASVRSRAVATMTRLSACENPLGVPEDDLPIYFGDVEGTNSRYFASSDYLAASWARPAVQSAMYSLEQAREGWLAKRDSDIRQQMNEYEAERRLEGLELSYAQPVMDACGITDQDALDVLDGDVDPTTCFRLGGCSSPNDPACLRGSLGEAMLGVSAATKALRYEMNQSAKRELEWFQQIQTCEFVEQSLAHQLVAVAAYKAHAYHARENSDGWVLGKVFSPITDGLDAVSGGAWSALGFDDIMIDTVKGCISGGGTGEGCMMGLINSDAGAREDLEIARAEMDAALAIGRADIELHGCWDEIERRQRDWIFGKDAILLRAFDLKQAWYRFDELARAVSRQVKEGKAAIAREEGRTLPSVAHHYWVDEKIARFQRDFGRAKRFTYLAMRAVEYEFQQSLGLRTQILTAEHPDDLVEALDILDAERATRSINSRRPAPGTEVLSLRSDILGLGNLYDDPDTSGERTDPGTRRLQALLTSPESAYYDENGEYLGQAIPFTVAESGALRYRCGERLWRVTATIQGDLTDVDEPRGQVYLLKRNVFESQWCEGLGDGTSYQQGSTAGGSNLFTADATTVGRQGSEFTPALIYPWYNVRRSDFYRDDYTQGSSEELAGRGLYGEYVLLFPNYGMLEPPADCPESNTCGETGQSAGCSDSFRDLRRIEDVLVRFDYYSVDDL